ncbi:MAG TPA: isoaspartyl peptidase/L-asparaginase [Pirellulales bacterium]|nr:isoaspartyl peptidase/L-asparaginase [Pirellulales bacterium]
MALLAALPTLSVEAGEPPVADVVLGIHGGAGGPKGDSSPQMQQALRADLDRALAAGYARLQQADGSSLDAVEAAIRVLEDSPHFNAGKGAVFTHEGRVELDASIMEGKALRAGAVAAVTTLKNPIAAARAVMEKSSSVLLVGHGAEAFAATAGLEIVDPSYFRTERRWQEIEEVWKKEKEAAGAADKSSRREDADPAHTWGTVGAVAVDRHGNLAAGTSTGGRVNKMHGRLGDSPIIGAGTYADNATCAISATGHGEFFIRYVAAYDVAALMKYRGLAIADAAAEVIKIKLKRAGGEGGLIALDAKGNLAMPFNTHTMYRGYIQRDGTRKVMLSGQ